MVHLVRITDKDYRDYRRSYAKIEYSFRTKDEPQFVIPEGEKKKYMDAAILKKGEFLDELEMPGVEMYFIKNEAEEIIGVTRFTIKQKGKEKHCIIIMFAVFLKGQGLGTEAFAELKKLLKSKGVKIVKLECPFNGARVFWEKQGFYHVRNTDSTYETWFPK